MEKLSQKKNTDRLILIGLALIAVITTFVTSPYSPLFRYCYEPDEICYLVVSRGWISGKIPYRDLFDHKGPLTYVFYALGLLLSGGKNWGIWIVFSCINIGNFILIYKCLRVLFDTYRSWAATTILLCLFFIKSPSLYASGSKPEHIILLLLLLSEFLILKGIRKYKEKSAEETKDSIVFSVRDMFLIGLCAGAVFAIKMNICIYYLCLIGAYFLWLLIRKAWKGFAKSVGAFLGGIGLICAPVAIYYAVSGGLSDLLSAYFTFNLKYAGKGGLKLHFYREWIDTHNQLVIVVLFLFLALASMLFLMQKNDQLQHRIVVAVGFIVYFTLSLPEVFAYSFCVLIPIYLLALGYMADIVVALHPEKTLQVIFTCVLVFVLIFFNLGKLLIHPKPPVDKTDLEKAMLTYYESHPDADCLYFTNLCDLFFYDYSPTVPSYKHFYMPREGTGDMYTQQTEYVRQGIPDVIAFYRPDTIDDEFLLKLEIFFETNGYTLYFDDSENTKYYIFVRYEG